MEPADGAPLAPLIAARNYTGLIKSLDAALAGATPNPAARAQLLINRGVCLHALGLLRRALKVGHGRAWGRAAWGARGGGIVARARGGVRVGGQEGSRAEWALACAPPAARRFPSPPASPRPLTLPPAPPPLGGRTTRARWSWCRGTLLRCCSARAC